MTTRTERRDQWGQTPRWQAPIRPAGTERVSPCSHPTNARGRAFPFESFLSQ